MTRDQNHQPRIRTRFRRHECKYLISEESAAAIRSYASPYLKPDPYAAAEPDLSYDISSLYLDSPDLKLFRETEDGLLNRIKLRIRTYDDAPESPVFLEIKRRFNQLVLKGRAPVDRNVMATLLAGGAPDASFLQVDHQDCYEEFSAWMARWLAQPTVWVGYRREAYVGTINRDVRITMDRNLRCCPVDRANGMARISWQPVETRMVVLEVKFDHSFPDWVTRLIQQFQLDRRSYSKYGMSIRRGLTDGSVIAPGMESYTS